MNIFTIIHLLFMIYVLAVPLFSKCHQTLFLHISVLFLLLLHWITNNDVCVLTEIEQFFYPNKERHDLFTNRLIGSVYKINNNELREVVLIIMLFTMYKYTYYAGNKSLILDMC